MKRQPDALWEPIPHDQYLHETVDGAYVTGTVVRCYRHTDDATPHPARRDNLTRWLVSTSLTGMAWIRWDFVRGQWVRAQGQRDGAPVSWPIAAADREDPRQARSSTTGAFRPAA